MTKRRAKQPAYVTEQDDLNDPSRTQPLGKAPERVRGKGRQGQQGQQGHNSVKPESSPVSPKTPTQGAYIAALRASLEGEAPSQTFVTGPAGTGKTYLAARVAAEFYKTGQIESIILARPNIPSGRPLGFYPGSPDQKMAPWAVPLIEAIGIGLGPSRVVGDMRAGKIKVVPFETMRGRTFRNAFVILDEAQNTTPHEMEMFLTRIGEGCIVVVNGDVTQSDLNRDGRHHLSGFAHALRVAHRYDLPVNFIEFGLEDVVRSDITGRWVRAFWSNRNPEKESYHDGVDLGSESGSEPEREPPLAQIGMIHRPVTYGSDRDQLPFRFPSFYNF
jgi:phosphate starvation-inducible PhoH-like protein